MSLSTAKANLKTAIKALRAIEDENYDSSDPQNPNPDKAIDDYLDALETFIGSAKLTIPIGGVVVTGTAATQNNPAPIVVDNSLS